MNEQDTTTCGGCGERPLPAGPGIGRRTFLAQGAVLAAVAALAACGGGGTDAGGGFPTAPPLTTSTTITLSDHPSLNAVGGIALLTIGGNPVALVRTGASTFVALSRVCPHQGTVVNTSGSGFLCPNHGAQFSASGTWQGGQPTSDMRSYPTVYNAAAGTVTIG
jgi:nitrite reductase/ring-hydroxylating ferredoxin subunit